MLQKDERIYSLQASLCRALSNPIRLMIIDVLKDGEATVSELQDVLGTQQPNLSQHLAVLRSAGIVESRKDGAKAHYSLTNPRIVEACSLVRSILRDQSERLGRMVNRE